MGARLRVFLTREQDKTFRNLITTNVLQKVKDRAEVIRLNACRLYVEKIAAHFNWIPQTVREVLHKWTKLVIEALLDKQSSWAKSKWKVEEIVFLAILFKKRTTYTQKCSTLSNCADNEPIHRCKEIQNLWSCRGKPGLVHLF